MLKDEELKYIEGEIKKMVSSVSNEYFQVVMSDMRSYPEEYPGWTEEWIKDRLIDLYYHICTYFEARGMLNLLRAFEDKYKEQILTKVSLLDGEMTHPDGESELKLLTGFKRFLDPFKPFNSKESQEEELHRLIKILEHTGFIIKNTGHVIKGEADIYKQVKWVLGLYYPSCKGKSKSAFIKQFKAYNPDILVPELKTAIEYKYLRSKADNVDDFIDQIKIDASAYTGDRYYENFIAVFYIGDVGIATTESIELAWKAKELPSNWTLVITGDSGKPSRIKG